MKRSSSGPRSRRRSRSGRRMRRSSSSGSIAIDRSPRYPPSAISGGSSNDGSGRPRQSLLPLLPALHRKGEHHGEHTDDRGIREKYDIAGASAYTPSAERTVRLPGVDSVSLLMWPRICSLTLSRRRVAPGAELEPHIVALNRRFLFPYERRSNSCSRLVDPSVPMPSFSSSLRRVRSRGTGSCSRLPRSRPGASTICWSSP